MNERGTRKRGESRGVRFQRERKERRIQRDEEETQDKDAFSFPDKVTSTEPQLGTPLKESDLHQHAETHISNELEHSISPVQEEERYVVGLGRSSYLD